MNKEGRILEPSLYGFPSDEMGFLIEVRSEHTDNVEDIVASVKLQKSINIMKARKLGYHIENVHELEVTKEFKDHIYTKYRLSELPDFTRNVYEWVDMSHHTGFIGNFATAGLHVHFSKREITGMKCKLISLPINEIVWNMDDQFREIILNSNRLLGEYEMKPWGFEYRSLPNTAPIITVTKYALELLESV